MLSTFDEGTDLVLYYKHLMVLNGDLEYSLHFNDSDVLSDAQRNPQDAETRLQMISQLAKAEIGRAHV